tara:strand:+ start:80 stop:256 length:177 start_codon:yes stop_codon:yes gene_type:complete
MVKENKSKIGKLYRFRGRYVLVLKQHVHAGTLAVIPSYYVLFPEGFIDTVASESLKNI